jgi:hypothetical protein
MLYILHLISPFPINLPTAKKDSALPCRSLLHLLRALAIAETLIRWVSLDRKMPSAFDALSRVCDCWWYRSPFHVLFEREKEKARASDEVRTRIKNKEIRNWVSIGNPRGKGRCDNVQSSGHSVRRSIAILPARNPWGQSRQNKKKKSRISSCPGLSRRLHPVGFSCRIVQS